MGLDMNDTVLALLTVIFLGTAALVAVVAISIAVLYYIAGFTLAEGMHLLGLV